MDPAEGDHRRAVDTFATRRSGTLGGAPASWWSLPAFGDAAAGGRADVVDRLPYTVKVLLENLLRNEDGELVRADAAQGLVDAAAGAEGSIDQFPFRPGRVLMQDFTGVPALADLASLRDAAQQVGADPASVGPRVPADLVVDHSITATVTSTADALSRNLELEYEQNGERYEFLKWAQQAFPGLRVVPPGTGICHQVNIEHLASVVTLAEGEAFPDSLVGTDSHTTMVNGLGVLGWGVGGIEALAVLLAEPITLGRPDVVGVHLEGELRTGVTATDLVLTLTEVLRAHGVVGRFVEFHGPGLAAMPVETRATIANMAPEYGSTASTFPIDGETVDYLRRTGRPDAHLALVEAYAKEQGLWHRPDVLPSFAESLTLDLGDVVPSVAGPRRPQDRVALADVAAAVRASIGASADVGAVDQASAASFPASDPSAVATSAPRHGDSPSDAPRRAPGAGAPAADDAGTPTEVHVRRGSGAETMDDRERRDGDVVIAAITSCTNTSNPSVMIAAGLLAEAAVERGLEPKPWVKASLAPGSQVVMDYLDRADLTEPLSRLGFDLVGFGCTTCIGNSGPLPDPVAAEVRARDLAVAAVLSGNRNFEGRINPDVRLNFLASPPLVVAYALAGTTDIDLTADPIGTDRDGRPVHLGDLWPTEQAIARAAAGSIGPELFVERYRDVDAGDERWAALPAPTGASMAWNTESTYLRLPPFVERARTEPDPTTDIVAARLLAWLGDSVTTDHISPAGSIPVDSDAGRWLIDHGVEPADFNSYGSRRGNHEVMVRGTFANIRLRNRLRPDASGSATRLWPNGDPMSIFEASEHYRRAGTPLVVLAGKDYGTGSSRDWAAKGTTMLGVRAVVAESFERIHRSNLVGMGVLPVQLPPGVTGGSLDLRGDEVVEITGVARACADGSGPSDRVVTVRIGDHELDGRVRIDTDREAAYYRHGGILPFIASRSGPTAAT